MTWPKAYGGLGLTLREHLVVNKEVGALAMPESVSSIGKELAGPIIQTVGGEEQKQSFLPRILSMRRFLVPGLFRARCRLRPGAPAYQGGAGR